MFDHRLQEKVIKIVDCSYGGENGFNQAIDLGADALSDVKFVQEKKLLHQYFTNISKLLARSPTVSVTHLKRSSLGLWNILLSSRT